jgi:serine/threonine-protein kinase
MEWVEGRLLREIIQEEGTLSIERSLRITARICSVLAYIHQLGIVHLDLKPDNLIVDPADNIRLIDFDLAREIKPRFWSWLRPKHSGTPDYASPEQILGKSIGVQSDLYALGMILYEMLTGEVPFSGLGPATAVKLRALADPLPPSEINPDVPAELDNLICRTVARSPEKRPVNAKRLCEELESLARLCAGNRVVSV